MDINQMLSGLLGGLSSSDAAIRAEQPRAAEATAGIATAGNTMQQHVARSIDLSNQAAQRTAAMEYSKAVYGEQAQRTANLDPEDLNNSYVRTMAELTSVTAQREASMAEYRSLTETSLMDNPIGYVFNQLKLPTVAQQHNNLATQQDNLTSDLATRTQLMYQNKTQVTANVASAAQDIKLLEAEAQQSAAQANAEKIKQENFGRVSTARMNELALQDKLNGNAASKYSAGMTAANFAANQAERAEARAERAAARALRVADKATKDAEEGALAAGLVRVSGALGYPQIVTLDDFKRMPASKAKQAIYNAAIEGTYGPDLASSIEFLATGNINKMQQQDPAFVKGVKSISAAVNRYATTVQSKPENAKLKPDEARAQGADQYLTAVTLSAHDPKAAMPLNDVYWDNVFNPNRPQHVTMIALAANGQFPQLANNSYFKVLQTVGKTVPPGSLEFRGEDTSNSIKALAELVASRQVSVQQAAADLVSYTRLAANYNQTTLKTASLTMPVQENAYVRVPGSFIGSGAVTGDTMNQAGAERLIADLAISRARALSNIPGFGGIDRLALDELLGTTK